MDALTMLRSIVMKGLFVFIGIVALIVLTIPVQAAPITYDFSGTVTGVFAAGAPPPFSIGDTLNGSYTFESTTAPRVSFGDISAVYDALTVLSFSLGSYSASSTGSSEIRVLNGADDHYEVVSSSADGLTGQPLIGLTQFSLQLDDPTGFQFTTALTLPTDLSLSNFTSKSFRVSFGSFDIAGTLDELSQTAAIPEPCTILLLGSGLVGLVAFRKKFRG